MAARLMRKALAAYVDAAAIVVLGIAVGGFELMRERVRVVQLAIKRRLSYRVAIQLIVVIATSAAIVLASREINLESFILSIEAPDAPSSTAGAPEPRGPRQAPTEWQLEMRSSPELAAQYPLAELYTDDEIAYFKEIAFGIDPQVMVAGLDPRLIETMVENVKKDAVDGVYKWGGGVIGYYLAGDLTAGDLAVVGWTISRLESLIPMLRFRPLELSQVRTHTPLLFVVFKRWGDGLLDDVVASGMDQVCGSGSDSCRRLRHRWCPSHH